METERIHNLIEQDHSVQRTCFMHNRNNFSQRNSFDPDSDVFDKLSPTKAMLGEDCSKRPLLIDGVLTTPFKKKKELHEELVSNNACTDKYFEKSKSDEDNVTSCSKFGRENLCRSTSSISEKSGLGKFEFSLQSSVFVKTDDTAKWSKLKCFDSIINDGSKSATFFVGGPIQCSAFSIMPCDTKVNQYIAVAASNVFHTKHSYTDTSNKNGIIQFWNLGSLHEKKLNHRPSMELALCHDNGIITQMKWCPADCYDKSPSTSRLPILGLLAASSSDSSVYIYRIPQPDFMPKLNPTLPIYFTLPFIKLIPLFGGPSNTTKKSVATCIEWEKNGERIVAGYGNGAVCVWMIKFSSFDSHITVKKTGQSYIIQPYLFFQASGAGIESLSFASFSCHRWLVVSSIDKMLRFFDLHDTSLPFHVVKQGLENTCIWADTFCGVYSSPTLNSLGLLSLSARDICAETIDKGIQKGVSGLFDSLAHVAVSKDKNFHAIADIAGTVTVNSLQNCHKPLETSYLTYMIFETEIMNLDSIVDQELTTSVSKINISGNNLSSNIIYANDVKSPFYADLKKGSSSSSSSSGFCSPKHSKTIVIEKPPYFEDNAINLLDSLPGSSVTNIKDINNNGINAFSNKPLTFKEEAETEIEMVESEFSEDLMHDLLMVKISNQSKSSSHTLPFDISKNSVYSDSNSAKQFYGGSLITSPAASDYTGDTIVYSLESHIHNTSRSNELKLVESQSKSFDLIEKRNVLHEKGKSPLKTECVAENSSNFSCTEIKSEKFETLLQDPHSSKSSFSKKWCERNCNLNDKNKNLGENHYCNYDHNSCCSNGYHLTSKFSDISREEYHGSKKSPKDPLKSRDTLSQNLDTKGNLISEKDAAKLHISLHKSLDVPSPRNFESKNLNQSKSLSDSGSARTNNDFIICDRNDQKLSIGALNHSSAVSGCSGDTVIYSHESYNCNKTGANYLKMEDPSAISKSLYDKMKENTFQDTLLHNMDEEATSYSSKTTSSGNCSSFNSERKSQSSLISEIDSVAKSCNSSDKNRSFYQNEFFTSDFHLLHSEYLFDKSSEEKNTILNELPKRDKNPRELSYENLIASFGVMFKNNSDKNDNLLTSQENDIYIKHNPLSVIKTISWDPNEGCQPWLFLGGNSGIARLVFVSDFIPDISKKQQTK